MTKSANIEEPELSDQQIENFCNRVGLLLSLDGDAWMCTLGDFECLAEDPAGFGYTKWDALRNLIKEY